MRRMNSVESVAKRVSDTTWAVQARTTESRSSLSRSAEDALIRHASVESHGQHGEEPVHAILASVPASLAGLVAVHHCLLCLDVLADRADGFTRCGI